MPDMRFAPPNPIRIADRSSGMNAVSVRSYNERLVLSLSLAVVVALAIRVVGSLLISAMLIVPAAAARTWARSPERMAAVAALMAAAAVVSGLWASLRLDTPAGPSIVASAAIFFLLSQGLRRR